MPVPAAAGELVAPLAIAEIISPIMAMKNGFGLGRSLEEQSVRPIVSQGRWDCAAEACACDWTLPEVVWWFSQAQ